ncbi:MAG: Uncharacterised protein [Hyphomonas sp. TMED17]|nr:MAG: Uncharacterised protein [Hyphomonas sp. TMED17]
MAQVDRVEEHFRQQQNWCRASPFMFQLHQAMADNYRAKGIIADLIADWPDNISRDAVSLRLAAALHLAALERPDTGLQAVYPAAKPDWTMAEIWPLADRYLTDHVEDVRSFIQSPPQTNEVNRSLILLPGFLDVSVRSGQPLHLLELAASAGLNQNWDRYNYFTNTWTRTGQSDVTLKATWSGPVPRHLDHTPLIVSRAACDLNPINVSDPAAARRLKAYVGADQFERLTRLEQAIALAREIGGVPDQADAVDWLHKKLKQRSRAGVTVIYHSMFLHYPPENTRRALLDLIAAAGEAATETAPLAWLCYESEGFFRGNSQPGRLVSHLTYWPGGETKVMAESDGHALSVTAV